MFFSIPSRLSFSYQANQRTVIVKTDPVGENLKSIYRLNTDFFKKMELFFHFFVKAVDPLFVALSHKSITFYYMNNRKWNKTINFSRLRYLKVE